jgi:hypothetical protein
MDGLSPGAWGAKESRRQAGSAWTHWAASGVTSTFKRNLLSRRIPRNPGGTGECAG